MERLTGKSKHGGETKYSFVRSIASLNSVNKKELKKLYNELYDRLLPYENTEMEPEEAVRLRKAFALACRLLEDVMDCPAADGDASWPECDGETGACGDRNRWECWQKYFLEKAENVDVCRVCGCTDDHACEGGCWWVEEDLCSRCAEKMEKGGAQGA